MIKLLFKHFTHTNMYVHTFQNFHVPSHDTNDKSNILSIKKLACPERPQRPKLPVPTETIQRDFGRAAGDTGKLIVIISKRLVEFEL